MSHEEDPLALIHAIRNNNTLDEIRELITSGIDVDKQDEDGLTALMVTAEHGGEHGAGMMRFLLDAKADANKQNNYRMTVLMLAAQQYGASTARGWCARSSTLELMSTSRKRVDRADVGRQYGGENAAGMVRLLLDAKADANRQSARGWTALMLGRTVWVRGQCATARLSRRYAPYKISNSQHT